MGPLAPRARLRRSNYQATVPPLKAIALHCLCRGHPLLPYFRLFPFAQLPKQQRCRSPVLASRQEQRTSKVTETRLGLPACPLSYNILSELSSSSVTHGFVKFPSPSPFMTARDTTTQIQILPMVHRLCCLTLHLLDSRGTSCDGP